MDSQFFLLQILLAVFDILTMCSFQIEDNLQGLMVEYAVNKVMLFWTFDAHAYDHWSMDVVCR
jgi:hypothetical protein